jgi:hypothetical protein
VEGVEWVGEVSKDRPDSYTAGATNFLHAEHERRSRRGGGGRGGVHSRTQGTLR